jgi:gamma-glutamyl hercynylcysteine S-oxide synthase
MNSQTVGLETVERLRSVRSQTVQLFDLVTSEAVLRTEPMPGFRPLLWHLAHIGVYQNYWLLQRCAGEPSINLKYDIYFDPIRTPREEAPQLPSRSEIDAYLQETTERVETFLANADLDRKPSNGTLTPSYAVDLVYEHECQHQETIAFVMQALPFADKKAGTSTAGGKRGSHPWEIFVPGIRAHVGARGEGFAYDNELPAHAVEVAAFYIDRDLTTNAEYVAFVESGGYEQRSLWSDEGWSWKESSNAARPLYWSQKPYFETGFYKQSPLREDAPVTGISWYEAEAYAKFRGKRLPSEFEWEIAASWDPKSEAMRRFPWGDHRRSERSQLPAFGTHPVGTRHDRTSALGMNDVVGNLWQWTSSEFRGYPGFTPYPYPEYSQSWFDGDHCVARGGSWFTWPALERTSFRNFYRRHFRPAFIGIRCARDAR